MIELNPSEYPSEIATLLLLRGAGVPPIEWGKQQVRHAREVLDVSNDVRLFARESLADEAMGSAVRSLLYMLNGWLSVGEARAVDAPPLEKAYLLSICARQEGDPEVAKTFLQKVEDHAVHEPLALYALEALVGNTEPPIKRFAGILEMGGMWEAFAFVDLFEQAKAGRLSPPAYDAVARIQCREFELLFAHCFKAAVGDRPVVKTHEQLQARKKAAARRAVQPKPKRQAAAAATTSNQASAQKQPIEALAPVRVRCPRCKNIVTLPGTLCGKTAHCIKCRSLFSVPNRTPAVTR